MDVVGEPVQQRAGEAFRTEHLGPLIEGQVGGDQDGAALVALAEDLEEQFRPVLDIVRPGCTLSFQGYSLQVSGYGLVCCVPEFIVVYVLVELFSLVRGTVCFGACWHQPGLPQRSLKGGSAAV